jgi:hypothetical protein
MACNRDIFTLLTLQGHFYLILLGTQDSSVGIVTGYRLNGWGVGFWAPVGARFSFSPHHPDWFWGSSSLLSKWYWRLFPPRIKWPEREAELQPLGHPACSHSLYQLHYAGSPVHDQIPKLVLNSYFCFTNPWLNQEYTTLKWRVKIWVAICYCHLFIYIYISVGQMSREVKWSKNKR